MRGRVPPADMALVLALVLVSLAVTACGGASSTVSAAAATPASPSAAASGAVLVAATAPTGWQTKPSADGTSVVLAASAADLDAAVASGPRLSIEPVAAAAPDASALIAGLKATTLVGEVTTSTVTIAGRQVVAVEWTESGPAGSQTYRESVVNLGAGRAVSVVLEAPAAGWAAAVSALEAAAGTITLR
jgi:hypothetical protein